MENASQPQAKSTCMKILQGAIFIFGVSYLFYVLVIALGPLVEPAHKAVKLRVHLKSNSAGGTEGASWNAILKTGSKGEVEHLKAVLPGGNQAPSLQTGLQPELEAAEEGDQDSTAQAVAGGSQAFNQAGKAYEPPLKQKGADQAVTKEAQKAVAAEVVKMQNWAAKQGNSSAKKEVKKGGTDDLGNEAEKELMISQQQRAQLEQQLKKDYDSVS